MTNKMKWLSPKMYTALMTLFAIAVLNLFFSIVVSLSPVAFEQQTARAIEPTVKYRLVEKHTVQYVEKLVTVVEYVERTKKVPVELCNFSDLGELEQWLVDVDMNTTTIYFQSPGITVDCDDYALGMQQKALADGYLVSLEIIEYSEYNRFFKNSELPPNTLHAINLAVIGNDAYYIEPQTNEIGFAIHLD